MKDYKDYMDSISVDQRLHDKIVERVTRKTAPQNRSHPIFRYAAVAACAVFVMMGVWMLPGVWTQNNELPLPVAPPDMTTPMLPPAVHELHEVRELTFNPMPGEEFGGSRMMVPSFSHELTVEQYGAVFPGLDPAFTATASYWLQPTSQIWWTQPIDRVIGLIPPDPVITQVEVSAVDSGGQARIRLARGQIFDCYLLADRELQSSHVHGVEVVSTIDNRYIFDDDDFTRMYYVRADFMLGNIAYRVSYHNASQQATKARVTELVNQLIIGGAADWSVLADPVIPELRDEVMPLSYARADPDFGAYLPVSVPAGFAFEHARRFLNQHDNSLFALWGGRQNTIRWVVRAPTEDDQRRIVSPDEREKFDMSLYSIPLFDSVPSHLREYVHNPVFLAEDMSIDVIRARVFDVSRPGAAAPDWSIDFSVLYGDVLIDINIRGMSPEQVWDILPTR